MFPSFQNTPFEFIRTTSFADRILQTSKNVFLYCICLIARFSQNLSFLLEFSLVYFSLFLSQLLQYVLLYYAFRLRLCLLWNHKVGKQQLVLR